MAWLLASFTTTVKVTLEVLDDESWLSEVNTSIEAGVAVGVVPVPPPPFDVVPALPPPPPHAARAAVNSAAAIHLIIFIMVFPESSFLLQSC
jgi:hypothetical protein